MSRTVQKGATSQIEMLEVLDSASTTGGRKTGIAFNTASLTAYYTRAGAAPVAIALVTQTAAGAWSSGGFVEIDATNTPGLYRVDVPNAAYATGADSVVITLKGAAGMVQVSKEIMLVAYNPQDGVRMGQTALPNAAANAAGGLPVSIAGALDLDEMNVDIEAIQTSTAGLTYTVANQIDANVLDWKSGVAPAMTGDAFARLGVPAGASIAADLAEIEVETDTILAGDSPGVTTLLTRVPGTVQPQTGDSFARLGAPTGASIAADLAEIEAETDGIVVGGVTVATNNDKTGYSLNLGQLLAAPAATDGTQAHTLGEALNAARAQGFGKWVFIGTAETVYGPDGATAWRIFTLDSAVAPTSRV